ncbi:MAG: hypothetical protein CO035_00480, partial [Candidatus Omnitrophica bacterium CG_4_9_14_0_2_um_filter_42_8]
TSKADIKGFLFNDGKLERVDYNNICEKKLQGTNLAVYIENTIVDDKIVSTYYELIDGTKKGRILDGERNSSGIIFTFKEGEFKDIKFASPIELAELQNEMKEIRSQGWNFNTRTRQVSHIRGGMNPTITYTTETMSDQEYGRYEELKSKIETMVSKENQILSDAYVKGFQVISKDGKVLFAERSEWGVDVKIIDYVDDLGFARKAIVTSDDTNYGKVTLGIALDENNMAIGTYLIGLQQKEDGVYENKYENVDQIRIGQTIYQRKMEEASAVAKAANYKLFDYYRVFITEEAAYSNGSFSQEVVINQDRKLTLKEAEDFASNLSAENEELDQDKIKAWLSWSRATDELTDKKYLGIMQSPVEMENIGNQIKSILDERGADKYAVDKTGGISVIKLVDYTMDVVFVVSLLGSEFGLPIFVKAGQKGLMKIFEKAVLKEVATALSKSVVKIAAVNLGLSIVISCVINKRLPTMAEFGAIVQSSITIAVLINLIPVGGGKLLAKSKILGNLANVTKTSKVLSGWRNVIKIAGRETSIILAGGLGFAAISQTNNLMNYGTFLSFKDTINYIAMGALFMGVMRIFKWGFYGIKGGAQPQSLTSAKASNLLRDFSANPAKAFTMIGNSSLQTALSFGFAGPLFALAGYAMTGDWEGKADGVGFLASAFILSPLNMAKMGLWLGPIMMVFQAAPVSKVGNIFAESGGFRVSSLPKFIRGTWKSYKNNTSIIEELKTMKTAGWLENGLIGALDSAPLIATTLKGAELLGEKVIMATNSFFKLGMDYETQIKPMASNFAFFLLLLMPARLEAKAFIAKTKEGADVEVNWIGFTYKNPQEAVKELDVLISADKITEV